MAKRSTSAKIWLGLGTCLILFAGLVWLSHWRAVNSLQAWKARMIAQGERFGIDELAPPLAPNDPKAVELMAAANRLRGHSFDPGYFLSLDFIAPGQARAPWLGTNLTGSQGRGPATWLQVAQEIESARDDLDAIHAGLKHAAATSVINYRNLGPSGGVIVSKRVAAQWLACEAIEQLHRNDLAGAQDTLLTLSAFARLHRNDLTLVNQMMRVAFARLAFEATWPALQVPGWTEAPLAELQSQWQQLEFFKVLASTIEMERASALELFERVRTNGWQQVRGSAAPSPAPNLRAIFEERVLGAVWRVAWAEQDELFYLETMQRVLEALRSASQHKSWTRLSVELGETNNRIEARLNAFDSFRYALSGMSFANWQRVFEHVMRQETQRSLMIAAIALQRYQLHYGKVPPDLESLAPEFLAAASVDFMNGQPLHYGVEPDGSFRLYSVGLDGQDDGGNPQPVSAWKSFASIFDGRDAVWPRLASSEMETAGAELQILPLVQFADAPVPDVIRVLAREADLRVRIDPNLKMELLAPVTIRLENMTALDALETILKRNRLVLVKHAGTNLVGITTK
jgi:hypothetical protein